MKLRHLRRHMGSPLFLLLALSSAPFLLSACGGAELRPLASAPLERKPAEGQAPVHTESLRIEMTFNEDGTYTKKETHRYRIVDQNGVENWAHVYAYFSPWYMNKPTISAKVINGSQTVPLDQNILTEQPAYPQAPDIYGDSRTIRGPLPSVTIGSVIEEEITTKTHKPFLSPASLHQFPVATSIPRDKFELVISAPAKLPVQFEVREADVEKTEKKVGDRTVTTFKGGPFTALEAPETYIPNDLPYWPSIAVSTGDDWGKLARNYAKQIDERLTGVDFRSTVEEATESSDSRQEKIAKLHAWVKKHVRYIGVEFGESSVIPYAPDQTVARGFGDCKDQATLLVGLLRAAGIDAHVALLRAGLGEDILPKMPALNVFNHAIVYIPGEDELWIDPTADMLPLGVLPSSDQRRWALVADESENKVRQTPVFDSDANYYKETRALKLIAAGENEVVEEASARGLLDWDLRSDFSSSHEEIEKSLKKYVKDTYSAEELEDFHIDDPLELLKPFHFRAAAKKVDFGYVGLLESSVYLRESPVLNWVPSTLKEGEEERESPFVLPLPYQMDLEWTITPPDGFVVRDKPEPLKRNFGVSTLTRKVEEASDHTVSMNVHFDSRQARLTAKEVQQFRDDYADWQRTTLPLLSFEHQAQKLVREGKVKEGVSLLQKQSQAGKESALALMRLASILRPFNMDLSHELGKKAAQQAENDKLILAEYAHLVAKNDAGEDMGEGFDRQATIDAYAKAAALEDAEKDEFYLTLREAVALEFNEKGKRYEVPHADLEKAIAIYDSIPAKGLREFDDGSFRNNALFSLYFAEKYQDLHGRLRALPSEEVPASLAVKNEAMRKLSADGAVDEADRLNLKEGVRAAALEEASGALAQKRLYADATRVLELAQQVMEKPEQLNNRIKTVRRTKKIDLDKLPESTPEELAIKLVVIAVSKKDDLDKSLKKYLAKDAQLKGDESRAWEFFEGMNKARRDSDLPAEFFADISYAALSATSEGSDADGFRVTVTQDFHAKNVKYILYVVKEGGRYKIRSVNERSPEMGAQALKLHQAGKTKSAKRWLDWAREKMQVSGGEDPLGVAPFARFWNQGKGDVDLAAAALAAYADDPKPAVKVLLSALAKEKDSAKKQYILQSLTWAYDNLEDYSSKLKYADVLLKELPDSRTAFWIRQNALWDLKNYEEYKKGIVARQKKGLEKERLELIRRLAHTETALGNIREGMKVRQKLIDDKDATSNDYNSQAWDGLFTDFGDEHLQYAQRSIEINANLGNTHTIGCIYAERGDLNEAARALEKILRAREGHKPEPIDYFIIGRIAEHLGYKAEAKKAYRLVDKPEEEFTTSTYRLAQMRLKKL